MSVEGGGPAELRLQDSNLDLTAPKAVVLPLHQSGLRYSPYKCDRHALRKFPSRRWGGRSLPRELPFMWAPHSWVTMRPNTRLALLTVPALLTLTLAACSAPAATVASDDGPIASAPAEVPAPTALPADQDVVLYVRATATAPNGAAMALVQQVHQAYAWDYTGTGTLPAAIIADCGGAITQEQISAGQYSFVRANISALAASGSADWPADARVDLKPSATTAYVSARGTLMSDPASGSAACVQDKYLAGPGNGGMAIGIPGDAAALTGWTNHAYGFTASAGVMLSDCSFEVTELGTSLGGGSGSWSTVMDSQSCLAGNPAEQPNY